MLLDDQPDWLRINSRALAKAGYECVTHTRPDDALKEFRKTPGRFPLVIVDINLGDPTDGVKAGLAILAVRPQAQVVLVSSTDQLRKQEKALEQMAKKGGVRYMRKEGDEKGGQQVVGVARQVLALMGVPRSLSEKQKACSPGGLMVWLQSEPTEDEKDTPKA